MCIDRKSENGNVVQWFVTSGVQHFHWWRVCVHHHHADCSQAGVFPWRHSVCHLPLSAMVSPVDSLCDSHRSSISRSGASEIGLLLLCYYTEASAAAVAYWGIVSSSGAERHYRQQWRRKALSAAVAQRGLNAGCQCDVMESCVFWTQVVSSGHGAGQRVRPVIWWRW